MPQRPRFSTDGLIRPCIDVVRIQWLLLVASVPFWYAHRRVQQTTFGHRGRKGDPLYRGRRVFLTGWERLTNDRLGWLFELLAVGDPDDEVGAAILAHELLREVYAAVDVAHARRRLVVFLQHCGS